MSTLIEAANRRRQQSRDRNHERYQTDPEYRNRANDQYRTRYLNDPEWAEQRKAYFRAWRLANPEKAKAGRAAWYAANSEKAKTATAAWRAAHPEEWKALLARRRARKAAVTIMDLAVDQLKAKWAYWGGRCWIQGPRCRGDAASWDHVKPLAKGGAHILANLRPACRSCNSHKHDKWPWPAARIY